MMTSFMISKAHAEHAGITFLDNCGPETKARLGDRAVSQLANCPPDGYGPMSDSAEKTKALVGGLLCPGVHCPGIHCPGVHCPGVHC